MEARLALASALSPQEARMLSPLQLAYVGDSVHALLTRTHLMGKNLPVRDMHAAANRQLSAVAQARELQRLLPLLTEEEMDIVRRGRNAHPHHAAPKSATAEEYAGATGLEALLGYLYLTGRADRLAHLSAHLQSEEENHG